MNDKITILKTWFKTRDTRERILITMVFAAFTYAVWSFFIERPLTHRHIELVNKIETTKIAIEAVRQQTKNILDITAKSSYAQEIQQQKKLTGQAQNFKQRIENLLPNVIAPKDLPALGTAIVQQPGITFIGMKKLPSENWIPEGLSKVSLPEKSKNIYKYSMEIEFYSDYFGTVDYLSRLEKLPWHIFWDSLEYKVIQYPKADVKLKIYVLSYQAI
jgi:MSHA biogenesis protein MshJ